MEYVYASMLLHSAEKPIDEASVTKVLEAAGVKADPSKVKALVASLKDVDIEEAIKSAAAVQAVAAAPAPSAGGDAKAEESKEEEDEKKTEEEAAAGLGALFG